MSGNGPSPTNLERLKEKLKAESLAARLIDAQMNTKAGAEQAALKKVIAHRLEELRKKHAVADHQA
jgi:hypothetical protein